MVEVVAFVGGLRETGGRCRGGKLKLCTGSKQPALAFTYVHSLDSNAGLEVEHSLKNPTLCSRSPLTHTDTAPPALNLSAPVLPAGRLRPPPFPSPHPAPGDPAPFCAPLASDLSHERSAAPRTRVFHQNAPLLYPSTAEAH